MITSTVGALVGSVVAGGYALAGSARGLFDFFLNAIGLGWLL